jgi:hypothetical protein
MGTGGLAPPLALKERRLLVGKVNLYGRHSRLLARRAHELP